MADSDAAIGIGAVPEVHLPGRGPVLDRGAIRAACGGARVPVRDPGPADDTEAG